MYHFDSINLKSPQYIASRICVEGEEIQGFKLEKSMPMAPAPWPRLKNGRGAGGEVEATIKMGGIRKASG